MTNALTLKSFGFNELSYEEALSTDGGADAGLIIVGGVLVVGAVVGAVFCPASIPFTTKLILSVASGAGGAAVGVGIAK